MHVHNYLALTFVVLSIVIVIGALSDATRRKPTPYLSQATLYWLAAAYLFFGIMESFEAFNPPVLSDRLKVVLLVLVFGCSFMYLRGRLHFIFESNRRKRK